MVDVEAATNQESNMETLKAGSTIGARVYWTNPELGNEFQGTVIEKYGHKFLIACEDGLERLVTVDE